MLFLVGALGEQEASCFKEGLSILAPDVILQARQKYRLDQPSEWPAEILEFRGELTAVFIKVDEFAGPEHEKESSTGYLGIYQAVARAVSRLDSEP